jgi:hypothetical protein
MVATHFTGVRIPPRPQQISLIRINNKNNQSEMAPAKSRKYLFGWTNLKFVLRELVKLYSPQPSFFSKKRLESGMAFIIAQFGMIYFLTIKISTMTASDLAIWAGIEFAVAGYIINHIQKEKRESNNSQ